MLSLPESDEIWSLLSLCDKYCSCCSIYFIKYKSKIIISAVAWDSHHEILTVISKLYLGYFFSSPTFMHLALVEDKYWIRQIFARSNLLVFNALCFPQIITLDG